MDALKQKYNEQIKSLMPINGLAPQYQNEVIQRAEIINFKKKQQIFKQKDVDPWTYYLLEGELELEANGQLIKTIKGGSMDAQSALSQLQPRQMGAKSKGKSVVLRVARDVMDRFLTMDDPGPAAGAMEVSEVEVDEDDGGDWMTRMLQSELFSRIPPANIQRLFAVMESVPMQAGTVVVEQGSPGDYYYIIQAGRCEVTRKANASGAPIKLAELGNGDSFGEEALVSDAKRNATVTMTSDGELVRLTKEDFIELIKKPSLDTVDYEAAKALVAEGACWLDLRFADEHAKDGLDASVNLPLNQLRGELKNLESERTYIAYCDSGARSAAGAFLLAQNGFDVRHLEGGLNQIPGRESAASAPEPEPEPEVQAEPEAAEAEAEPEAEERAAAPEPAPAPAPEKKAPPAPASKAPAAAPEKKAPPAAAASEKKAPPAAKPAPAKSDNADVRAAELAEDVAKADTRMEEAMRLKAQAEAEKRAAAKKLQSKNKELEAKAAKARAELEKKAAEANAALEEAKRERVALEKARRAAEAEAEAKRHEEEQRLEQLKKENEERLNAERAKLEAEYAKQADELAQLQALKEKAKAELEAERKAMEQQASEASRELEQIEQAKHQAEAEEIERRIREQSESAIRAERQRLEAEFARAAEQLAEAQREREMAELIKDEAARKAARTIAEQKVAQELARQEEELKLNLERQKLQAEAKRLRQTLEEAKKAKAQAQAKAKAAEAARRKKLKEQEAKVARDMMAASHKKDPRQAAPSSQDDELARANSLLAAAEAAHRKAEEAKQDLEDTQSWKKSELDSLRKQMEAELADFMNENPTPKKDDADQKKRAERMAMYEKRRKAEEQKRADANSSILNDIASQLEK